MPSSKDRLYVALYARGGASMMPGGEDRYHWALILGPKFEDDEARGKRFHAKESLSFEQGQRRTVWAFEEREIGMAPTAMILVRILVAKVKNRDRLISVVRGVPIRGGQPGWNCVEWVREALQMIQMDRKAIGTAVVDWPTVRDASLRYVMEKEADHRFDGQAAPGLYDTEKVPTWTLLEGSESIP
ncbi:hypothetical protein OCS_06296 [Ophiocordyceps sinensis CO18]|uniref:Uncharacterized protein n=1 Tax=Ophiocordyceps sinensis (strain Co18 / CGMCC 3.14243) TaxID=911162 RepID=T5A8A4_OPHSC|nr:hypothetical protein OCS_06296 [Ophiocordyceps sinensis CO18]